MPRMMTTFQETLFSTPKKLDRGSSPIFRLFATDINAVRFGTLPACDPRISMPPVISYVCKSWK